MPQRENQSYKRKAEISPPKSAVEKDSAER